MNSFACMNQMSTHMQKAIAYYRVSTEHQGKSGLGLEAQQKSVGDFASGNGLVIVEEFVETQSGARNGRLGLMAALQECKHQEATLLIARLDRLSRNLAFIATLMESGVDFKVVNNPYAEKFTIHILAAVAEKEREDISQRTTLALAAARRRGVELGTYGRYVLSQRNRTRAEQFALKMQPVIAKIIAKGKITLRAITQELNRLKVPTYRNTGQRWHLNTVHTLVSRLKRLNMPPFNQGK